MSFDFRNDIKDRVGLVDFSRNESALNLVGELFLQGPSIHKMDEVP